MVICVLLKVAATYTTPCGMTRRSRFFLNSFLRFVAAGFAGAPVSGAVPAAFGSFATLHSVRSSQGLKPCQPGRSMLRPYKSHFASKLPLLADNLLLRRHRAAPRTFPRTGVGVCPLATHGKVPAVPDPAVRLNFDQAPDIHLDLFAEIALHPAFLLDFLAQAVHFLLGQVADLLGVIDVGLRREIL